MKGMAGTWELTARYSVESRTQLFISIPYSYYSVRENDIQQGSLGNLSFGAQFAQKNGKTNITLGMIIPIASEDKFEAVGTGIISDYYHFTNMPLIYLLFYSIIPIIITYRKRGSLDLNWAHSFQFISGPLMRKYC
jgi:hypothetical protein